MTPCGECRLGLVGGSVCPACKGTTFISNTPNMDEANIEAVVAEPVVEAPAEAVVETATEIETATPSETVE